MSKAGFGECGKRFLEGVVSLGSIVARYDRLQYSTESQPKTGVLHYILSPWAAGHPGPLSLFRHTAASLHPSDPR